MLKELNKMNPSIEILPIENSNFEQYGAVLKNCDFSDMFSITMDAIDLSGPTYIRDIDDLHKCNSSELLIYSVFGETKLQIGICFGNNDKMNGMEYHKSSEVIIAVTDIVLILGDVRDIKDNNWDSSMAQCFYIPQGTVIELYGGTLHLAPCRASLEPFCSIIVLPEGTNLPLKAIEKKKDFLLFKNNKWLLCHKDSPSVKMGAYTGITGNNIQIHI
ncbi:MAG: DUF4867 family protein [Spirochaetia bacterium]|jgi:hypothetical protein|nr:DUF4867 family protein [Spirochaetia bacterium]